MKQKIVGEKPCTQMQGLEEKNLCTNAMAKTGKDLDELRIQTTSPDPETPLERVKEKVCGALFDHKTKSVVEMEPQRQQGRER